MSPEFFRMHDFRPIDHQPMPCQPVSSTGLVQPPASQAPVTSELPSQALMHIPFAAQASKHSTLHHLFSCPSTRPPGWLGCPAMCCFVRSWSWTVTCSSKTLEDRLSRRSEISSGYKSKKECVAREVVSMFQCFTANHASCLDLPSQLSFGGHFERRFINAVHRFKPNHSSWIGVPWQQSFGGHFERRFINAVQYSYWNSVDRFARTDVARANPYA